MPIEGEYAPSPEGWVRKQVETYEASGGTKGTTLQGVPCVVLWTRGRSSGKVRKNPLMRVEHDGAWAVVASNGGATEHPQWYQNLLAEPDVTLQDGPAVVDVHARVAEGEERDAWWARSVEVWPAYDDYQTKTDRRIPVVVLEPR
jgi:deazaflavin-dependent oxidoreductase (nitroreductase family)